MALFFNRIKGCDRTTTGSSGSFTYIYWSYIIASDPSSGNSVDVRKITSSPEIKVAKLDDDKEPTSLGHILTTDIIGGYINNAFLFKSDVSISNDFQIRPFIPGVNNFNGVKTFQIIEYNDAHNDWNGKIEMTNENLTLSCSRSNRSAIKIDKSKIYILNTNPGTEANENYHFTFDTNGLTTGLTIKAKTFNATSDIRAKDNIIRANFNALDIICNLPIYTFNYKNDVAKIPSLGIIAQEAKDVKINNFELIDNQEATGLDGDFMSVKESKLVYILMKAVQEQQEQIKNLQLEIKKLKDLQ